MDDNIISLNNDNNISDTTITTTNEQLGSILTHVGALILGITGTLIYTKFRDCMEERSIAQMNLMNQKKKDAEIARLLSKQRWQRLKRQVYLSIGLLGGIGSLYAYNRYRVAISNVTGIFGSSTGSSTNRYKTVTA